MKRVFYICNLCKDDSIKFPKKEFVGVVKNPDGKAVAVMAESAELHVCLECRKGLLKGGEK